MATPKAKPNVFHFMSVLRFALANASVWLLVAGALADDAWVGNGGTPEPRSVKHSHIRMADEVVKIRVTPNFTYVDCLFHFVNNGPATAVRMGFPDEAERSDFDKTVKSVFKSFNSWVDGKRVRCHFEGNSDVGYWQSKAVKFSRNGKRTVRDRYSVKTGLGNQGWDIYLKYVAYTLSTGNTWKGAIGDVRVEVSLENSLPQPLRLVPYYVWDERGEVLANLNESTAGVLLKKLMRRHLHTIFWKGPTKPTLRHGELIFHCKNLLPKEADNIFLAFAPFRP